MKDDSPLYVGQDIESTVEHLASGLPIALFWIIWVILTGGAMVGFIRFDSEQLED